MSAKGYALRREVVAVVEGGEDVLVWLGGLAREAYPIAALDGLEFAVEGVFANRYLAFGGAWRHGVIAIGEAVGGVCVSVSVGL